MVLNKQHRDIIISDWYQKRWGNVCTITKDTIAQTQWFENAQHGFRYSTSVGGGAHVDGKVKKVAPFTSIPQVQFKLNVSTFSDEGTREQIFYTVSPTSGTINPQWLGEDFVSASIVLLFESALSGVVDTYFDVRFKPSN